MGKYQKNIEAARRISVMQYLETYHPGELVRKTDKEYRTKTHSSLVMPDEIRRMRDDECLLLMRSEDPVIDRKYNLLKHPNVKYTPDAGGEPYVMPPDYMGDAATITMDAVAAATAPEITEEMYEQLDYLEKHPEENYNENAENFSQWYEQGGE